MEHVSEQLLSTPLNKPEPVVAQPSSVAISSAVSKTADFERHLPLSVRLNQ